MLSCLSRLLFVHAPVLQEMYSIQASNQPVLAVGPKIPTLVLPLHAQGCRKYHDFYFSVQSLRNMSRELEARGLPGRADMVWLLDCSTNIIDAQLDVFAQYGHGIGPEKVWPCFSLHPC